MKKLPPVKISLVHGQLESADKERALADFRSGASQLLVGTTVLEVGIDVPEASVIVIESPERYGLSQLHQLRGRVGRGARRGVCVLLSGAASDAARLRKFAATNDGFEIARIDLETRGAGELAGLAQHGDAGFVSRTSRATRSSPSSQGATRRSSRRAAAFRTAERPPREILV